MKGWESWDFSIGRMLCLFSIGKMSEKEPLSALTLQLQILSVKPVDCNNSNSVFSLPGRPRGWPRDWDTCHESRDYWVRSYRCSMTQPRCKSHRHRVCQHLWLRVKCLAQRLSMHHQIFNFVCSMPDQAEVTTDFGLERT
jgi:hypothetical protein